MSWVDLCLFRLCVGIVTLELACCFSVLLDLKKNYLLFFQCIQFFFFFGMKTELTVTVLSCGECYLSNYFIVLAIFMSFLLVFFLFC